MIEPLAALAARAAAALMERQQTIAVADGATGGLISAGLLTVPGATAFYLGGGVIYSLKGRDILLDLDESELAGMRSVTEPYALLGFRAGYDFGENLSFYIDARNLTDERYIASASTAGIATANSALFEPGSGRAIYAWLQARW